MKKFKTIDFWINITLIIISILTAIIARTYWGIGYFIVGAWQLISTFVHILSPAFKIGKARKIYHIMLIIVVCSVLLALPFDAIIIALSGLLVISPFMAVYYTKVCYQETFKQNKRPLDQLK